jgi:uncharacterized membrane protein
VSGAVVRPFFDTVFATLFKYRPVLFKQGHVVFRSPVSIQVLLALALAATVAAAWTYGRARAKSTPRERAFLFGARCTVLALLTFALLRPTLVLSTVLPQQNYLAVLIDDSRSMRIADAGDSTRGDAARRLFTSADSRIFRDLSAKFRVRTFRFAEDANRLEKGDSLLFMGGRTRIAPALERVRAEMSSLPLAGVVVVSDGADNAQEGLSETLLSLKAAGVPIYTVGLGRERAERDIEVGRITMRRRALKGSSIVVELVLTQSGFSGKTVPVVIEDEGRILSSTDVKLPADDSPATVQVHFTINDPGPRRIRFRVPPQQGEVVTENNVQENIIDVSAAREKILYFEGEPRYELKFVRRAIAADSAIQLVTLQRTAEKRFLRLDIDSAGELAAGFPATREELFSYRALVLGSIEASYFTHDQLEMISDFVSERGGGLLMLGGHRSFAEGGWAGTPVGDALPVTLDAGLTGDTAFFATLAVTPTPAGLAHPAMRLAPDADASAERWKTMPAPSTTNRIRGLKPGATALLVGNGEGIRNQVVLAHQRFGRGISIAFPIQDSWVWQMDATVPVEDQTHETFWRQVLRWLVSDVPDRMAVDLSPDHVAPGEAVRITAHLSDERFGKVNDARVLADVTSPTGEVTQVALPWSADADGQYRATFPATMTGMYEVHAHAERAGAANVEANAAYVEVAPSTSEYFEAGMRSSLLRRISAETGGHFYTQSTLGNLAEDVAYSGKGLVAQEEKDLWDMPAILLGVLLLLAAEWGFRRYRGLA